MKARGKIMTAVCIVLLGVLAWVGPGWSGGATPELPLVSKSNGATYVVVDDFDSYENNVELFSVWNDHWVNSSGAQIFLQKDPNFIFVRDGNSVWLLYDNSFRKAGTYIGSWMDANPAELEVGSDWTVSGANTLVIYFYGHAGNSTTINDRMWVELEDSSGNVGLVLYDGDADDLKEEWWHEWNIDLGSFDACGVDLAEVGSVAIGFGGFWRTGQTADGGIGYVWFDDIRLYEDGDVTPGLIAHWKFDEGTGGTAYDSVGSNHGTLINGPSWVNGQVGGALEFDGGPYGAYVDAGDMPALDITGDEITVMAWFKPASSDGAVNINAQIVSKWLGTNSAYTLGYDYLGETNTIMFVVYTGMNGVAYGSIAVDDTSKWYHLTGVYNGSEVIVYIDGVAGTPAGHTGNIYNSSMPLRISGYGNGHRTVDGTIDDVRIYNRALSGAEIWQLYEDGLGGMVAHWKFDEGTGTTAYDSAGSNHGTLVNGPGWASGQVGGALDFDGVDDYVDCGNGASINSLSAFSVCMWFKADVVCGPMHRHLIAQRDLGDIVWTLILHRDYSCRLTGRVETSGTPAVGRSNFIPEAGQWYHAAMTYDDAGDRTLRVYVDGVEQSYMLQTPATGTILFDPSVSIAIGNRIGGGKEFDGIIDDVMIFNRALSAAEVEALYQGGLANTAPVACIVGGNTVVEAGEDCVGRVVLDGSCSSDADSTAGTNDDINDFEWYEVIDACEPNSDIYIGSGEVIECNLGLGEHVIVLEVTDKAGAFDTNEVVITVEDVTPPELSLTVEPNILWPPNGKMVLVRPEWEVSDNCDEEVEVSLVDISMSVAGDVNDYVEMGDDGSIYLRARRSKGKDIRVYTLTYEAVDDSGNVTEASTTAAVRHRKGPRKLPGRLLKSPDGRLRRQVYRRGLQRR
ncbi:MAG: LamG domain-containing protein [Planctomycetota bacterium]|nr:MAG: LamG domain-containing protein [Planctomycetota bacterium]